MPNATAQSTKSAAYCTPCALSCWVTSDRWLHFCGATAIHLMLLPPAKSATATRDQAESNPDGPPVFFAKQLAPGRAALERLTINSVGDFRHKDSG